MQRKITKTNQGEPQQRLVMAGGKVFDLNDPRYRWLKAFDSETRLYILSGLARD